MLKITYCVARTHARGSLTGRIVQVEVMTLNGARSANYPHDGYVCNRCNVGGHLIRDCPGIFGTSGFAHPSLSQRAPADRIAKEVRHVSE